MKTIRLISLLLIITSLGVFFLYGENIKLKKQIKILQKNNVDMVRNLAHKSDYHKWNDKIMSGLIRENAKLKKEKYLLIYVSLDTEGNFYRNGRLYKGKDIK